MIFAQGYRTLDMLLDVPLLLVKELLFDSVPNSIRELNGSDFFGLRSYVHHC